MRSRSGPECRGTSSPKRGFSSMSQVPETPGGKAVASLNWENEGGSEPAPPLPDGITAVAIIQYRGGPCTCSRLDHALAEHQRQARND